MIFALNNQCWEAVFTYARFMSRKNFIGVQSFATVHLGMYTNFKLKSSIYKFTQFDTVFYAGSDVHAPGADI